ncbi:D-amino-acid transaminase [Paenibacillus agricola]|uniref:D-alanine aminotransferase n=1 Tax=Paenibacillus agricola TaxID=2716264 RepID=A0ABX0JAX7_9BACL|nr:D-amino-acid transaminase [Paenibacillus agricola]NHN31106.1 D-amino-acid transaminase [Paenibacillus agricola]
MFPLEEWFTLYLYQQDFIAKEQLAISPDDRGYYFGDGIYEVFRVYKGELFEADGHYRRLELSSADTRIPLPYSIPELHAKLLELIHLNRLREGTVYMQVTRGIAPRSHPYPAKAEPVLMAYCNELKRPLQTMQKGITAVTSADIRWLRCDLKTLNLLPNVMAKQQALDLGANEVVWHRDRVVTECSASNFMIVRNGEIWTHPANHLILHGITRDVVIRLAQKLHIQVHQAPFKIEEMMSADEAFVTGTTVEVTPVISVDGVYIGQGELGPVTRRLQQAFEEYVGI